MTIPVVLHEMKQAPLTTSEQDGNITALTEILEKFGFELLQQGTWPTTDRILFLDYSEDKKVGWLLLGTGLAISGTTLNLDATLQALAALDATAGVLLQTGEDTFSKLAVGASTIVGRKATGDIAALSVAEVEALLTGVAKLTGATFRGNVVVAPTTHNANCILNAPTGYMPWIVFRINNANKFGIQHNPNVTFINHYVDIGAIWFNAYDAGTTTLETLMRLIPNGSVELYHNGTKIVETKSDAWSPAVDDAYNMGESDKRWNDVYATNGTIQTSDAEKKRDILDTTLSLDFINALRPVSYKWKDTEIPEEVIPAEPEVKDEKGKIIQPAKSEKIIPARTIKHTRPHEGLIAQEVKAAMDKLGIEDFAGFIHDPETDSYGLRYHEFISPMIRAIQELSAKNDELEARVKALENVLREK